MTEHSSTTSVREPVKFRTAQQKAGKPNGRLWQRTAEEVSHRRSRLWMTLSLRCRSASGQRCSRRSNVFRQSGITTFQSAICLELFSGSTGSGTLCRDSIAVVPVCGQKTAGLQISKPRSAVLCRWADLHIYRPEEDRPFPPVMNYPAPTAKTHELVSSIVHERRTRAYRPALIWS